MQKLHVFAVDADGQLRLGLARNPNHLAAFPDGSGTEVESIYVITPPLPSTQAHSELKLWQGRLQGQFRLLWRFLLLWRGASQLSSVIGGGKAAVPEVLSTAKLLTESRLVTETRLQQSLRKRGFWPAEISWAFDLGVFTGELIQFPGISQRQWGRHTCTRCNGEIFGEQPCTICARSNCRFCLSCASMGAIRECDTFFTSAVSYQPPQLGPVSLRLSHTLTSAQQQASGELLDFWQSAEKKALVWAACGAGKTEVTFPLISKALSDGKRVLFAIPRQDIVREMALRLQNAFPDVEIAVHYGGQPWLASGKLVVATTHQVLGFHRRFQLAILDEVDAFPYQGSEMLRFGLQRALMSGGRLVEMTATPTSVRNYDRVITIPARFHGHPLPEPRLIASPLPGWEELGPEHLPAVVLDLLQSESSPWLVFAPTIRACELLQNVLRAALQKKVGLCHSKEERRKNTIANFREGMLDVLVTTSVLERGVNFPGVQVIVLYADHILYNVSTLVQIAGRVGRGKANPRGAVLFVGSTVTAEMKKALSLIRSLNREAQRKGLLTSEESA